MRPPALDPASYPIAAWEGMSGESVAPRGAREGAAPRLAVTPVSLAA